MKVTIALLTAAVSVATAVPHVGHNHQHLHKRDVTTDVEIVPGPTVVAYILDGESISADEVQQGIANGTLVWANGGLAEKPSAPKTTTSASPPPATSSVAPASYEMPSSIPEAMQMPHGPSHGPPHGKPHGPPSDYPSGPPSGSPWSSSGEGVDTPFPSGEMSCDEFPSQYGAVPVNWMNLGGWIGIQTPGSSSGGYGDIHTATDGGCNEGSFCSYACPPGYQKSQWPETQGSTGQSIGGLQCKGGKLQLTNSKLSNTLCMKGASQVDIQVKNTLGEQVAVCRTDYPGTEAETVPLDAQPGSTSPLTCPDADSYYMWQGSHTSAQYYVNPAGVSVENGCQWGSAGNPWGNYAPLNLGVGYSNGAAWLSIFQNSPTTDVKLDFSVEIIGDGVSGTCKYHNGQYCGGANYDDCSSDTGCTVSISSGTATFVFS
ncbi:Beta-glucosidase (SUN) [Saxophila tyrrhenica]|uniref:Beta-glucosidase (SUN) n=1 Tax=Saxophila tyrrhenica TaxID=1690608 RepID=A0AAV9PB56_9PEZI|nr:Beta-glucosidase (SUN) [Saxophila tyrrhenica]